VSLRESGDPLSKLVEALDDFAERGPRRVLGALNRTGNDLVRETFDRSRAPTGEAWRPLKRGPSRSRPGRRPLVKTGNLRSLASHGVIVGSTSVWSTSRIGAFHQLGTRTIPARPFLPPGRLPLTWGLRLAHAAESTLPQWH
jgi:phage gpG-like protein